MKTEVDGFCFSLFSFRRFNECASKIDSNSFCTICIFMHAMQRWLQSLCPPFLEKKNKKSLITHRVSHRSSSEIAFSTVQFINICGRQACRMRKKNNNKTRQRRRRRRKVQIVKWMRCYLLCSHMCASNLFMAPINYDSVIPHAACIGRQTHARKHTHRQTSTNTRARTTMNDVSHTRLALVACVSNNIECAMHIRIWIWMWCMYAPVCACMACLYSALYRDCITFDGLAFLMPNAKASRTSAEYEMKNEMKTTKR